jgi:hypothetical protein
MTQEPSIKPVKEQAPLTLEKKIAMGFLICVLGAAFFKFGVTLPVKASVSCDKIQGGEACVISHDSENAQAISQCVSIKRVCFNGVLSEATSCFNQTLSPKANGRLVIADSEFSSHERCDKIEDSSVSLFAPASGALNLGR